MRQSEGGVPDLARLLAEDRTEKPFFAGKLGFALGRHFADKYIAGMNLGADGDDAFVIKVAEHIFADIGDIACDLLRPEFCVSGFAGIFFYMDRCINVISYKALASFVIDADKCKGCSACSRKCPTNAISGEIKHPYVIDQAKCIKCGSCMDTCKFGAISKN